MKLRTMSVIICSAVLFALTATGQEDPPPIHVTSSAPASSRFELVQSTLAAKLTFRLDKTTGYVSQLVKDANDELSWQIIPVLKIPPSQGTGVHYQLFISGLASKFTFLINVDTGKTWQLQNSKDEKTGEETLYFVPLT